jgi:hypothetical protein
MAVLNQRGERCRRAELAVRGRLSCVGAITAKGHNKIVPGQIGHSIYTTIASSDRDPRQNAGFVEA